MLNLTEIAARIKQPSICKLEDVDSLRTLCETYPYSQVFPLLYLKTLAQINDVRLDTELQKYAYRIADRAVLYNLLNSTNTIETTIEETVEPQIEEAPQAIVTPEPAIEEKAAPIVVEELVTQQEEISVDELVQEAITEKEIPEEIAPILESTISEPIDINFAIEEKIEMPQLDPLEQLILSPKLAYSLEKEEIKWQEQQEEQPANEAPIQEEIQVEKDIEEERKRLIANLAKKQPLIETIIGEKINESVENGSSIEENAKADKIEPEQKSVQSNQSFTSWLKASTGTTTSENSATKVSIIEDQPKATAVESADTKDIIDKFIKEEPKISSPKDKIFEDRSGQNEMFNPSKKAKESLDDSQLPVSETLAKIFAAQGNFPKAIYAYQQLMLIFPEKKAFFASQIEELNKKINT